MPSPQGSWKAQGRASALPVDALTDQLCQAELLADGAQLLAFEAVSVGALQPLPMVDTLRSPRRTPTAFAACSSPSFLKLWMVSTSPGAGGTNIRSREARGPSVFLGCIRSTSPEPKRVVQHVIRLGNVMLHGARFVSSGVCGPRPSLLEGLGVSQSSNIPVSVLLLVAC